MLESTEATPGLDDVYTTVPGEFVERICVKFASPVILVRFEPNKVVGTVSAVVVNWTD